MIAREMKTQTLLCQDLWDNPNVQEGSVDLHVHHVAHPPDPDHRLDHAELRHVEQHPHEEVRLDRLRHKCGQE